MGMDSNGGMSVADVMALQDRNDDGAFNGAGGTWIWVFFLFFLLAWGGNGFGGFGGNSAGATQADIQRGFDQNTVVNKLDGIAQGLCHTGYDTLNMSNQIQGAIANLGFQNSQCCCETNRNIDAVRYENAKNTCDIINAGNANTQRIIDTMTQNTIQELRDQLQNAKLDISNTIQTRNIVEAVRPFPIPAYPTCSPYTAANGYGGGCSYC